jgi:ribosomal RNA-processing protein 8
MALFDVPGWTVPDTLLSSQAGNNSRKRKRSDDIPQTDAAASWSSQKLQAAVQNVERLMASLGSEQQESDNSQKRGRGKGKNKQKKGGDVTAQQKEGEISMHNPPRTTRQDKNKGKQKRKAKSSDKADKLVNIEDSSAHSPDPIARNAHPTKKRKRANSGERFSHTKAEEASTPPISLKSKPVQDGKKKVEEGLTALQARMKHSLDGARFRSVYCVLPL